MSETDLRKKDSSSQKNEHLLVIIVFTEKINRHMGAKRIAQEIDNPKS